MITTPYHSIWAHYLSSYRSPEIKSKRQFQTFSSKTSRSRLREVLNTGDFTSKRLVVAEERSLMRGDRNQRFDHREQRSPV